MEPVFSDAQLVDIYVRLQLGIDIAHDELLAIGGFIETYPHVEGRLKQFADEARRTPHGYLAWRTSFMEQFANVRVLA